MLRRAFEQAFEDLKAYLSSTPLLSPSKPSEELYIYLVVSPYAVSSAFIREEGKIQMHVYYTNKVLRGAEVLEKHMFVSHTRHTFVSQINKSTSFTIDNIYYANFKIQEQVSVPW